MGGYMVGYMVGCTIAQIHPAPITPHPGHLSAIAISLPLEIAV
jgi:hypothetical protein